MFPKSFFKTGRRYAAITVSAAAVLGLTACEEKEAEKAPAAEAAPAAEPAPAVEAAPAPEADKLAETREALFNFAVYKLAQKVTKPEAFPELNSMVKDMLEIMQAYYEELKKGEPTLERAKLALQIASTTRDLGAFTKAQGEYESARKEVEGLPEDIKTSTEAQRILSSCCNGLGVCLLAQNKASEALLQYEAALAIDETQYKAVAPAEGEELPEGEVNPELSRSATDLLDSYRCLGDCQRVLDDPEEALATYNKGHELAQRLKRLSADMSIAYVKLLTSMGNQQNALNKSKEAMGAWVVAARICQGLNSSSPRLDVKAETKRCFDALLPAIQTVNQKLTQEQAEAKQKEEADKAAAEKAAAEAAEAEKAAAERLAAEQKAAEEKAAAEARAAAEQEAANKRVRDRRRR